MIGDLIVIGLVLALGYTWGRKDGTEISAGRRAMQAPAATPKKYNPDIDRVLGIRSNK